VNDCHCHFFSSRFFETLARELPEGVADPGVSIPQSLGWEAPGEPAELGDRWVREIDASGVSRVMLIASVPGDEVSVAEAVAHHPDRFVGAFMFNPMAPDAGERLLRALGELKLRCVCFFPAMHHYRMTHDRVEMAFDVAAAHGAATFVHCGVLSIGVRKMLNLPSRFDVRFGDPLGVAATAVQFPAVPVIIPHFGGGFFREALMAAELCPTVHFDTSSSNRWVKYHPNLTLDQAFRAALGVAGPERLLFGTDSSYFPRGWQKPLFDIQRAALEQAGADAAAQELIFSSNFDRLFS
jgi:predicted TIM-barrel fold metal-dependent hydrolase